MASGRRAREHACQQRDGARDLRCREGCARDDRGAARALDRDPLAVGRDRRVDGVSARRRPAPREGGDDVGLGHAADGDRARRRGRARARGGRRPRIAGGEDGDDAGCAQRRDVGVELRLAAARLAVVPGAVDDARRVVGLGVAVRIEHPLEHAVHGAGRAAATVAEDARGDDADVRRHRGDDLRDLGAVPARVLVEGRRVLVVGVEPGARRGCELREARHQARVEHGDDDVAAGLALRPERRRARRRDRHEGRAGRRHGGCCRLDPQRGGRARSPARRRGGAAGRSAPGVRAARSSRRSTAIARARASPRLTAPRSRRMSPDWSRRARACRDQGELPGAGSMWKLGRWAHVHDHGHIPFLRSRGRARARARPVASRHASAAGVATARALTPAAGTSRFAWPDRSRRRTR